MLEEEEMLSMSSSMWMKITLHTVLETVLRQA